MSLNPYRFCKISANGLTGLSASDATLLNPNVISTHNFPSGTGGFLTVRGEKSKIVQQHARKIVTEMQKREKIAKGKGKDVDLSIEELEDLSVDRAVVRIISWRGISEDGEDIPFTKENAARILKEHSWIKEAVFENSDELLNFRN